MDNLSWFRGGFRLAAFLLLCYSFIHPPPPSSRTMDFDVGKLETGEADRIDLQFAFLAGSRKAAFTSCGPENPEEVTDAFELLKLAPTAENMNPDPTAMAVRVGLTLAEPIPSVWLSMMRLFHLTDEQFASRAAAGQAFTDELKSGSRLSLANELAVLSDISKLQAALPVDDAQQPIMLAVRTAIDCLLDAWCIAFVESFPVVDKEGAAKLGKDEIAARKVATAAKHNDVVRQFQTHQDTSFGPDPITTRATWVRCVILACHEQHRQLIDWLRSSLGPPTHAQ